jgi:hypothetical protein
MNDIKVYEPLIIIFYKDEYDELDMVVTPLQNKQKLLNIMNKDMFIEIE